MLARRTVRRRWFGANPFVHGRRHGPSRPTVSESVRQSPGVLSMQTLERHAVPGAPEELVLPERPRRRPVATNLATVLARSAAAMMLGAGAIHFALMGRARGRVVESRPLLRDRGVVAGRARDAARVQADARGSPGWHRAQPRGAGRLDRVPHRGDRDRRRRHARGLGLDRRSVRGVRGRCDRGVGVAAVTSVRSASAERVGRFGCRRGHRSHGDRAHGMGVQPDVREREWHRRRRGLRRRSPPRRSRGHGRGCCRSRAHARAGGRQGTFSAEQRPPPRVRSRATSGGSRPGAAQPSDRRDDRGLTQVPDGRSRGSGRVSPGRTVLARARRALHQLRQRRGAEFRRRHGRCRPRGATLDHLRRHQPRLTRCRVHVLLDESEGAAGLRRPERPLALPREHLPEVRARGRSTRRTAWTRARPRRSAVRSAARS